MSNITIHEAKKMLLNEIDIQPLIDLSQNADIKCQDDAKNVLSMSMQARKLRKTLEESRKRVIKPHFDFQKSVNEIVKEYTNKLESIENSLKEKLVSWSTAQSLFEPSQKGVTIEVEDGKLTTKSSWEYEITDSDKVPRKYLKIDESKIKDALKSGERHIEGVRIFETKKITMRIKNE